MPQVGFQRRTDATGVSGDNARAGDISVLLRSEKPSPTIRPRTNRRALLNIELGRRHGLAYPVLLLVKRESECSRYTTAKFVAINTLLSDLLINDMPPVIPDQLNNYAESL